MSTSHALKIVQQIVGVALSIVELAEKAETNRGALRRLAEKAATLALLDKQVMSNRTVDGQLIPLLERLRLVFGAVEAFMLKETAKGNTLKKIYRSVFVLQYKVDHLSNELETEVRYFTASCMASGDGSVGDGTRERCTVAPEVQTGRIYYIRAGHTSSLTDTDLRAVFAPLDITTKISDVSSDARRFGGLADIYEGILDADGAQVKVAIKFIRSNDCELQKIMRRHRREVKIWYGIKHPYILPLLGLYWGSRSLPALVSTWCQHGNIRSYLETLPSGPEGIARKHEILHQIAQGLAHLHGQTPPIVHGDLKGDNILVSDDGLPKICDFGLSKIIAVTTETVTHFRGTLRWMAPELLCDDPVSTSASDIWAVVESAYIPRGQAAKYKAPRGGPTPRTYKRTS